MFNYENKIKKVVVLLVIFALMFAIPSYSQGGTISITNLRYTNGNAIPNGSAIEIIAGGARSITFDLNLSNPQLVLKKGYLYVFGKKISSANTSTQYVDVNFNNDKLSSWYSKEYTISLNALSFNTTGGVLYGEFFPLSGGSFKGNIIPVKVVPIPITPINNNSISANQTINEGQSASVISGSTPSGGNGTFIYTWQKKVGNGSWGTISGANGISYSPGFPASTTSYKRIVTSASTVTSISNELTIIVIPAPAIQNNTITLNGSTISGSLPTGGNDTYEYSWVLWGGAEDYDFPDTGQNLELHSGFYNDLNEKLKVNPGLSIVRYVKSGSQTLSSNVLKLLPTPAIQNNTITLSANTISGSLPSGGTGTYNYEWRYWDGDTTEFDILPGNGQNLELPSWIHSEHMEKLNARSGLYIIRDVRSGMVSNSNVVKIPLLNSKRTAFNSIESNIQIDMFEEELIKVYPNPTSESVNFESNFLENKGIEIIFNSEKLGNQKTIFKGTVIPSQVVKWNIPSNYKKGLYFYKILSGNKEIKTGKILFQ